MTLHRTISLVGNDDDPVARVVRVGERCVAPTTPAKPNACNELQAVWGPVLLAGPIVRRVEQNKIWLWLATSVPVEVKAKMGEVGAQVGSESVPLMQQYSPMGSGSSRSMKVGHRLHITLIQVNYNRHWDRKASGLASASLDSSFPTDTPLSYNIQLTIPQDMPWRFLQAYSGGREPVAIHSSEIALEGFQLPTLIVRSQYRGEMNLLHASCRKLHGSGEDTISRALQHLDQNADDPGKRPATLLLTGDQIYADDVHAKLIGPIIQLAEKIMGRQELLPADYGYAYWYESDGERKELISDGFSTEKGGNHLLTFGEFAAMYLLAWSGSIWRRFGAPVDGGSPQPQDAQRLLANISTYMIFDDHDVTDDWNLNYHWYDTAWDHLLTRRVVTNAVTAYGKFQGAGNDPEARYRYPSPPKNASEDRALADELAWKLPTGHGFLCGATKYPVVVLDTRTQRLLITNYPFAGLMNANELDWLKSRLDKLPPKQPNEPVIIVSPPPVLGFHLVEFFKEYVGNSTPYMMDAEQWSLREETFLAFLDVLLDSGRSRFVFLSGDVHYAFSAAGIYWVEGKGKIQLVQFTSSAIKNSWTDLANDPFRPSRDATEALLVAPSNRIHDYSGEHPHRGNERYNLVWRTMGDPYMPNNVGLVSVGQDKVSQSLLVPSSAGVEPQTVEIEWNRFPL